MADRTACVARRLNDTTVWMPVADVAVLRTDDRLGIGEFTFELVAEEFNQRCKHRVGTPVGEPEPFVLCEPEWDGSRRRRYVPMRHPLAVERKLKVYLRPACGRGRVQKFVVD